MRLRNMARDDKSPRDPEGKRPAGGAARGGPPQRGPGVQGAGRSGYGMESIRPHLRAQLERQKLLRPTFPPEPDDSGKTS